jgi:hypothetical protein
MKKFFSLNILIKVFFYIFLFIILLQNSFAYLDSDFGWHLQVGQDIHNEKNVPHLNYYNYTLENTNWVDHEWLANLFIYEIYDKLGYFWLNIFFTLIVVLTIFILNKVILRRYPSVNTGFLFLIEAWGVRASLPHMGIRVQEITLLCLVILMYALYEYSKNRKYRILFILPILFFFWACLHAGFLIGLFLLCLFIFVKTVEEFVLKRYIFLKNFDCSNAFKIKEIATFSGFAFLSFLVTLVTPYKLELYSFLSSYKNDFYLTRIQEWFPQFYFPLRYYQLFFIALVLTAFCLACFYSFRNKKLKIWDFCVVIIFLYLSIKSKRHFPLFFILTLPFLVSFLNSFLNLEAISKKVRQTGAVILILFFGYFIFLSVNKLVIIDNPSTFFCRDFPCRSLEFIQNNEQYRDLRIFSRYGWGGYLIWNWPEKKLFIDGRLPQYSFNGHTLLQEYFVFFDEGKTEEKLDEYNIELVLFDRERTFKVNWFERIFLGIKQEDIDNYTNPLEEYLKDSDNWKLVFSDQNSLIYVRKQ